MSDKNKQESPKLPNNFGSSMSRSKSNAPKISGAGGGNATGPAIANDTSKRNG